MIKIAPTNNPSHLDDSNTVTLTVHVNSAKNLKGSKPDKINTFVRVQFADFEFKDSPAVNETVTPSYNFDYHQDFHIDEESLSALLNKKVLVTVFEQLPKEKTSSLGSVEIPLYPHFFQPSSQSEDIAADPNTTWSQVLPLNSPATSGKSSDSTVSELDVQVQFSKPILKGYMLETGNILTIKVDDMRNLPEEWLLKDGTEKDVASNIYGYSLNFYFPINDQEVQILRVANGALVSGDLVADSPTVGPDTPTPNKAIRWNQTNICWLSPETVNIMRELVAKKVPAFHAEFTRYLLPKFANAPDAGSQTEKYRGRLHVEGSSLMFPKVLSMMGRYKVQSFAQESGEGYKALQTANERIPEAIDDVYATLQTNVGIEFILERPLLGKKKLQLITKSVSDFIPPKNIPAYLRHQKAANRATDEFKKQLEKTIHVLVKQYHESIKQASETLNVEFSDEPVDEQKKKHFAYHLNRSGVYFQLKEELKVAVVNIVREYFEKKSAFSTPGELQTFLSEVYVYLVEQMHSLLNKVYQEGPASLDGILPQGLDFSGLKALADEAESENIVSLAIIHHQQRIALDEDNVQGWFDYGTFCLRFKMTDKAEECFKEVLSRNPKHIPTLLALGSLCATHERIEQAHVLLKSAVDIQPHYGLGLTVLGLFYDFIDQESESEKALNEATAAHERNVARGSPSIFSIAADFLLKCNTLPFAERAISHELILSKNNVEPYLLLARLEEQKGRHEIALDHLKKLLDANNDNPEVWAAVANHYYAHGQRKEARTAYETLLSLEAEPKNISQVYFRLGKVYYDAGQESEQLLRMAKTMFLRSCESSPSASAWLGVGKAAYRLNEFTDAEDALSEANAMNNRDGEIWANLALLCLSMKRRFEANQAMVQALKMGVRDPEVLQLLGVSFLQEEDFRAAAECLRLSLEIQPNNEVTRDLFVTAVHRRPKTGDTEREPTHLQAFLRQAKAIGASPFPNLQADGMNKVVISTSLHNQTIHSVSKSAGRRPTSVAKGRKEEKVDFKFRFNSKGDPKASKAGPAM